MEFYDYKKLERLYKELTKKMEAGKADELEYALFEAAGQALDLVDIVNNSGSDLKLDLTADTEDAVPMAVSLVHMFSLASGEAGIKKGKEFIVKKLAGYELFAIYNELQRAEHDASFVVENGTAKIHAIAADGEPLVFDVYGVMEKTIKEFILATSPDAGFIAFGTMQPFYDALIKDFLKKLT